MYRITPLLVLIAFSVGCNLPANRNNLAGKRSFQTGNYSQAMAAFHTALANDPSNPDSHYNIGRTLHQLAKASKNKQQLAQAEAAYRQAINLNVAHQPSYRGLAVLLAENNRRNEAFELMQSWTRVEPNSAEPRIELARLYAEHGDTASATQLLNDAITVDFDNDRALRAMGLLREKAGDYQQALVNYQRSLKLNPMQPELESRVAQLQTRATAGTYGPAGVGSPTSGIRFAEAPSWPKY